MLVARVLLIAALVTAVGRPAPAWASSAAPIPFSLEQERSGGDVALDATSSAAARILVRFRQDASERAKADAIGGVGGRIDAELAAIGITRVALPASALAALGDATGAVARLARHPAVAHAELDRVVRLELDPNDQYYRTDPYVQLGQWGIRKTSTDLAWDKVRGSPNVTVAILDTGVDASHPDLQATLVPGATFVTQASTGCDARSTIDDNSHGTHVAGIVGASGNNGVGIAGVAFGVKLMPLKVLDCTGLGSLSDVASGMIWAADHGARVINLSLGSPFDDETLRRAVSYATRHNALVVSAAGNCGGGGCPSADQLEYPASYPDVLAVGSTDADDSVSFFSSENATVDVVAPGRRIVSTTPRYATYLSQRGATRTYAAFSGTSQASPFVAGLAALILSAEPLLTPQQVAQRVESTADQLGPGPRNDSYGYGRVNSLRAVAATAPERFGARYDTSALPRSVAVGTSFTARVRVTNTSSFAWRAADPGAVLLAWSWSGPGPARGASVPLGADLAPGATVGMTFAVGAPTSPGTYTLWLDLLRGSTAFSAKGVDPAALAVVAGSGVGATYAPTAGTSTAGVASFDLGSVSSLGVAVTNTGTTTWPAAGPSPVRLSYHWLQGGSVVQWDGLRAPLPGDVAPGASATVVLSVQPPARPGAYTLQLDLVQDGVAWFSRLGAVPQDLPATVRSSLAAAYSPGTAPVLLRGGRAVIPITVTNTGTATWTAAGPTPTRFAAHVVDLSGNVVAWDGARTELDRDVAPGARVSTTITVDAPLRAGAYRVSIDTVREGVAWLSSLGVRTADLDLFVTEDRRAAFSTGPVRVSRAGDITELTVRNTGVATWTSSGVAPVRLGVHWYDASGTVLVWDGPRTPLPGAVRPNDAVTVGVALGPTPPDAASLAIDLVSEGVSWFGAGPLRPVTFTP